MDTTPVEIPQHFNDSRWDFNLNEAQAWMDAHPKQRPSTHAQGPVEKTIGIWIHNREREYKNNKTMTEEQRVKWAQFVARNAESLLTPDQIWQRKFEQVKEFMRKNLRRPSRKKEEEAYLGKWLMDQIKFYKKKTMREDRCVQFGNFRNEFEI